MLIKAEEKWTWKTWCEELQREDGHLQAKCMQKYNRKETRETVGTKLNAGITTATCAEGGCTEGIHTAVRSHMDRMEMS